MQAHLAGPWREPRNTAADQKGGIHADATASNPGRRCRVWMEKDDGTLVMEGCAALGADPGSELGRRLQQVRAPIELRVFAGTRVGTRSGTLPTRIDSSTGS